MVGRTPWSAADALVGLLAPAPEFQIRRERPARGPAADQGVRPTRKRMSLQLRIFSSRYIPASEKTASGDQAAIWAGR